MKINEVKKKAKKIGINPGKMNKTDLIKSIQRAEGNFDCFGTATEYCDQLGCAWRNDCLKQ